VTREVRDYSQRFDVQAHGFNPDVPVAGFYRFRMRSGGALCGVRIWHGQPSDPVTGELLDRSLRWQAQVNGDPVDLARVWPKCAADPIDADEYEYLRSVQSWAKQHAPTSPQANLMQRINPLTAPTPF
jgi:hypothetical protein